MLLRTALAAKASEFGGRYTYRQLALDSDVDYSYVSKVLRERRRPSEQVLAAWSRALAPHFPLDVALVDAGYGPATASKLQLLRRIAAMGAQEWADFEAWIGQGAVGEIPDDESTDRSQDDASPNPPQRRSR